MAAVGTRPPTRSHVCAAGTVAAVLAEASEGALPPTPMSPPAGTHPQEPRRGLERRPHSAGPKQPTSSKEPRREPSDWRRDRAVRPSPGRPGAPGPVASVRQPHSCEDHVLAPPPRPVSPAGAVPCPCPAPRHSRRPGLRRLLLLASSRWSRPCHCSPPGPTGPTMVRRSRDHEALTRTAPLRRSAAGAQQWGRCPPCRPRTEAGGGRTAAHAGLGGPEPPRAQAPATPHGGAQTPPRPAGPEVTMVALLSDCRPGALPEGRPWQVALTLRKGQWGRTGW